MIESTYEPYREVMEAVRWPIGTALGLDDATIENLSIVKLQSLADLFTCKSFENHPMEWTFTEENEHLKDMPTAIKLSGAFTESERALVISKLVDRPFKVMDYKVQRILGAVEPIGPLD